MGNAKITTSNGHHFAKNAEIRFHTAEVVFSTHSQAWTIGSATACHADTKKLTMEPQIARTSMTSPCQARVVAMRTKAHAASILCHSDSTPLTMPFHAASRACHVASAAATIAFHAVSRACPVSTAAVLTACQTSRTTSRKVLKWPQA